MLTMSFFYLNQLLRIVLFAFISLQSSLYLISSTYCIKSVSSFVLLCGLITESKQNSFYGVSNFMSPKNRWLWISVQKQKTPRRGEDEPLMKMFHLSQELPSCEYYVVSYGDINRTNILLLGDVTVSHYHPPLAVCTRTIFVFHLCTETPSIDHIQHG